MRHFDKRYAGKKYNRLTIKRPTKKHNGTWWVECECECGNTRELRIDQVRRGMSKECKACAKRTGNAHPCWQGCGELSKNMFNTYRHHAANIGVEFAITIEEAWAKYEEQGGRCALSGRELRMPKTFKGQNKRTASLDRVDSTKGYVSGNIQWVHRDLNWLKKNVDNDEFIRICHEVAAHTQRPPDGERVVHGAWPGLCGG